MTVNISPAVSWREVDQTITTPGISPSTGAFVGDFVWGPVNDITQVTNETVLVDRFGQPNSTTFASFFTAKNFLDYSNNLMLIRVGKEGQGNATDKQIPINIPNETVYRQMMDPNYERNDFDVSMEDVGYDYELYPNGDQNEFDSERYEESDGKAPKTAYAAKYPGAIGNSLKLSICDASTYSRPFTGTIDVTQNSTTVVGTGTKFLDEIAVGSHIVFKHNIRTYIKQVVSVNSDTELDLESSSTITATGLSGEVRWEYYNLFGYAPIDSDKAISMGATGDGLHIVVIDEDGKFSGTKNSILEIFENVSKALDATKTDGTTGYYKNALNKGRYIWWLAHPDPTQMTNTGTEWGSKCELDTPFRNLINPLTFMLGGGSDGGLPDSGDYFTAYDLLKNTELLDISLIMTGKASIDVQRYVIQNIAEVRLDCVAFVSPSDFDGTPFIGNKAETLERILEWQDTLGLSSSYAVADTGYKYQYDKYNDVYRWVPLNGDVAGLCAYTDRVAEPWYSPAGLNRGQIKNVTKLAFNPNKAERDELFKRNVNPVVTFPGEGTILYGDKTMLRRPSAFDAINVRRLFIILEKAIAATSRYYLFEQNTEVTRQLFVASITPLLRDIQGRQGIYDFYVDVGATVNTADVIDSNEFRANIFIKPVRTIRYINLTFIATRTSASFTEIEINQ